MTDFNQITHSDIDWIKLWQNARDRKGWASKGPAEWDKKSSSFASRNKTSPYIDLLMSHLPLEADMTVLDVGSGPGTLALPIAKKVHSVTALDFSPGMLAILQDSARENGQKNIRTVECAWEDDWDAKSILPHDIAIASRSMSVDNIAEAIKKLNAHSSKYVFITDRISPTPFDPLLFEALGRNFESGPDYIYTLNILYTMGIHPNVTILELERELRFDNIDQALQSYSWMIKDLTTSEEHTLKRYLENTSTQNEQGRLVIHRDPPPRWALIWWDSSNL